MAKRRFKINPNKGKRFTPHTSTEIPPEQQKPIFSLEYLNGKHCLTKCNSEERTAFADTLHRLSQLPWVELKTAPKHGLGYEKIDKNSIRARIPDHVTEDTNIIAFRFYKKAPMVGYRKKRVFYILWLDRKFTLYSH